MDRGGSIQSNERAAEKLMDDYLKSIGLHRKKVAKDGSCLFRAVAEQVSWQNVRNKVLDSPERTQVMRGAGGLAVRDARADSPGRPE